jgi:hypothetical protein
MSLMFPTESASGDAGVPPIVLTTASYSSDHVVRLLDVLVVERVALAQKRAHLLDLRAVVVLALKHGDPGAGVLELAHHVHRHAGAARDQDGDVVGLEVRARADREARARGRLGGAERASARRGAGAEGQGRGRDCGREASR